MLVKLTPEHIQVKQKRKRTWNQENKRIWLKKKKKKKMMSINADIKDDWQ